MRKAPAEMGVVQRQVTAGNAPTLQAYQQQAVIDPSADDFARGLMGFADTIAGVSRERNEAALDAQAAAADIGMDGYSKAMDGVLKSRPELFDSPDELAKIDQELRGTYFKDITDERILGRITQRLDVGLQSAGQTYQIQKQEKQRTDLGIRTLQLSVEKLEELRASGGISLEDGVANLRAVVGHLKTSSSFGFSQEKVETVVRELQEVYGKDGSKQVLLAKAFMDDPEVSTETQLALRASYAEGMAMTAQEKAEKQFQLYQHLDSKVKGLKLSSKDLEPYIGTLLTAKDAQGWLDKQVTLQEKRIKDAEKKAQTVNLAQLAGDIRSRYSLSAKDRRAGDAMRRQMYFAQGEAGVAAYFREMKNLGDADPVTQEEAAAAVRANIGVLEPGQDLPPAWNNFYNGVGKALYYDGTLAAHVKPDDLVDVGTTLALKEQGGFDDATVYNMLSDKSLLSRMRDIPKNVQMSIEEEIRGSLELPEGMAHEGPTLGRQIALRLVASGFPTDAATATAVKTVKGMYDEDTKLPTAQIGSYGSPEKVNSVLEWAKGKLSETFGDEAENVEVHLMDGNHVGFMADGLPIFGSYRRVDQLAGSGPGTYEQKMREETAREVVENAND